MLLGWTQQHMAHTPTKQCWALVACVCTLMCVPGVARAGAGTTDQQPGGVYASDVTIRARPDQPRPPFAFDEHDAALLDEIESACFVYLWERVDPTTGLVADRSGGSIVSIAGVGYQLASLAVGVERGWITRTQGQARAERVLTSLLDEPTNRKAGLFYHFLDGPTARPAHGEFEFAVSTVDSAILFAGAIVAAEAFGGRTAQLTDSLLAQADWTFFQAAADEPAPIAGALSLAWVPADQADPTGDGRLLEYHWLDAADEQRLVVLLAIGAPDPSHRLDERAYYTLRRPLGEGPAGEPMVFNPYSGALLTAIQAHVWVDYAAIGVDSPSAFGVAQRAEVDWWENSRRVAAMQRARCAENPMGLATLGEGIWGLSACDTPTGYRALGLAPQPLRMLGAEPMVDDPGHEPTDEWGGGVVAPAAVGSTILFAPGPALDAMRAIKGLTRDDGSPLVWREPGDGGSGFRNGFTLDGPGGEPWAAADDLAIDHGMLLLAIEDARTGLIWRLFHAHETVADAVARLGLIDPSEVRETGDP